MPVKEPTPYERCKTRNAKKIFISDVVLSFILKLIMDNKIV